MLPTKIVVTLKSFSRKDLKKLEDFLNSPYFCTNESIVKLFQIVLKSYPDFNSRTLKYPQIFKKIYPHSEFREQTIRNLYSELANHIKEFIGYEELKARKEEIHGYIAGGYTRRRLYEISDRFIKKSLKENSDEKLSDFERFFYLFRIGSAGIDNKGYLMEQYSNDRLEAIYSELERLILFCISQTPVFGIEILDIYTYLPGKKKHTMINEFYKCFDVNAFINYLEKSKHKYASYTKIRYLIFYYFDNPISEKEYLVLKDEILKTIHKVNKTEQLNFITTIIHLLLTKITPVHKSYFKDVFEFGKLLCELNIYPDESVIRLNSGLFRNIFTVAIILKEYEWIDKFINKYSEYLNDENKENDINYCKGILSFKKGNYEASLDHFNKFKMKDIGEKINIRFYIMMNYIELKAYENALSALQSIRQFSQDRTEIPKMYSVLINDSVKFFNEIIKAEESGRKIDEIVYKEAHGPARCYHKQYIWDKMEKLNHSY